MKMLYEQDITLFEGISFLGVQGVAHIMLETISSCKSLQTSLFSTFEKLRNQCSPVSENNGRQARHPGVMLYHFINWHQHFLEAIIDLRSNSQANIKFLRLRIMIIVVFF